MGLKRWFTFTAFIFYVATHKLWFNWIFNLTDQYNRKEKNFFILYSGHKATNFFRSFWMTRICDCIFHFLELQPCHYSVEGFNETLSWMPWIDKVKKNMLCVLRKYFSPSYSCPPLNQFVPILDRGKISPQKANKSLITLVTSTL